VYPLVIGVIVRHDKLVIIKLPSLNFFFLRFIIMPFSILPPILKTSLRMAAMIIRTKLTERTELAEI
jgi:hypothetical protein